MGSVDFNHIPGLFIDEFVAVKLADPGIAAVTFPATAKFPVAEIMQQVASVGTLSVLSEPAVSDTSYFAIDIGMQKFELF